MTLQALTKDKQEIEEHLRKAHHIAQQKKTLELFITVSELVAKLQKLLDENFVHELDVFEKNPVLQPSQENQEAYKESNHLQRVAGQYHQLRYYVTEGLRVSFFWS